jgi:hypothetical protein
MSRCFRFVSVITPPSSSLKTVTSDVLFPPPFLCWLREGVSPPNLHPLGAHERRPHATIWE